MYSLSQVEDLSLGEQVNGDLNRMHHSGLLNDYDFSPGRGSPRGAPVKAVHDLSIMFPDTDSGFGSYKSRGRQLEDFSPAVSRLQRSSSLSRLNGLSTQEISEVLQEKPLRHVQSQLEDSESRRTVLMHKLKEAQATLELQNDRLAKIENSAKDNSVLVEDLKFKEKEYRKKITQLQASEEEKKMLQMENMRLREEMQNRIDTLDMHLRSLKNQHQSTEDENERRVNLLDHTTVALSLLEEENTKLQRDRDKLREEVGVMKEAFQLSKTRYSSVEEESKVHKAETDRLREENLGLNKRVHEMAGQMMELRNLLQAVKDDNERLSCSWRTVSEGKNRASKQAEGYQDTLTDLKSRLAGALADKDRLFQERLDLHNKLQKMILEKEQLLKAQMVLEEQVEDQQKILQKTHSSSSQQGNRKKHLEDELTAVKKVSEDLSSELSSVKAFYERALEQLSLADNSKKVQEQQLQLAEQERKRLQGEMHRLSQMVDGRHRDEREERQHLEETILKMRNQTKDLKYDKEQLTKKCQELETKLKKANDEIRGGIGKKQEDMETWSSACDRLTASVTRKETELQNLCDKCHSLEDQLSRAQEDLRQSREKEDVASEITEELDRLRDENRRLLQEKAENEQMLELLETQRDVLTKSTESSFNKLQDVEQLSGKVDQMRNENELLRERISELEKIRDNLIRQKEELLASSELIYKTPSLEELEGKMEELRGANKQLRDINDVMASKLQMVEQTPGLEELEGKMEELHSANKQLRDINDVMASKLQMVEQENLRLKQSMNDGASKEEVRRLQEENSRLLGESKKLRKENQQMASQASEASSKELLKLRKERDALQKQVQLVNGQLNLLEGSKKRSDDNAQRSQNKLSQVQSQLEVSREECSEAKRVAAQVKSLSQQLQKAKEQQENQEKLIRTMKEELEEERSKKPARIEESLEDVGAELQQMSGQLHKLKREIENKEQTIESLAGELRTAKDTADTKEHTLSDLKKVVRDLEAQNAALKTNLPVPPATSHREASASHDRPAPAFKPEGERSLKEELEEAVKNKQEADRAADEDREKAAATGKVTAGQTNTSSSSSSLSSSPSPAVASAQLPLFVLTAPSSSSEEEPASDTSAGVTSPEGYHGDTSTGVTSQEGIRADTSTGVTSPEGYHGDTSTGVTSPEGYRADTSTGVTIPESYPRRTSSPYLPGSAAKKFTFDSHPKDSSPITSKGASKLPSWSKPLLSNVSLDSSETGSGLGSDLTDSVSSYQEASLTSHKDRSSSENTGDASFFPVTGPAEETKPTLSFPKPQSASKTKSRKLPQIQLPSSSQAASALARKTSESKGGKSASSEVSGLPSIPKVATPGPKVLARGKPSPRESRNQFMSRRELTGKPSKLLSDSGVMVIATKTGSSQSSATDVKYVVKKRETGEKKDQGGSEVVSPPSTDQGGGLLRSFDELLGGGGGSVKSSSSSAGLFSSESPDSKSSKSQISDQSVTKESGRKDYQSVSKAKSESAYSKLKMASPSPQPAWKAAPSSEPSSSQEETSTSSTNPILAKSSSVKDFLASFSATGKKAGEKDKGKDVDAQSKDQKSKVDQPVKSLVSRFSSSGLKLTGGVAPKDTSSTQEPASRVYLHSVLPKEESEKQKLAELIVSLASQPSMGSSLSSNDSWTLLLDETAGERTLSYEKLEQLANKAKASASTTKDSKGATTDKSKEVILDKPSMVRSSSTSSLLSSCATLDSERRPSLEGGHPGKFKPATGVFLSKSLGHPISAVSGGGQASGGETEPDKPGTDSGDRLQSLISKYRSHSSDSSGGMIGSTGGGVTGRDNSFPSALRTGAPASPRGRDFPPKPSPFLRSSDVGQESSLAKKQPPPPPPPKPGKSLMKSLSGEIGAKGGRGRARGDSPGRCWIRRSRATSTR
ncbi:hypothetical protein ACOMHN_031671 [Nucella lapillus]